jgi:hypothetical protein
MVFRRAGLSIQPLCRSDLWPQGPMTEGWHSDGDVPDYQSGLRLLLIIINYH